MTRLNIAMVSLMVLSAIQNLAGQESPRFDKAQDLLIANFDCKTDVDDLHTAAALASLLRHPDFKDVQYHAIAGAYGMQNGLYVPPNSLFALAFGNHWSDADADRNRAVEETSRIALAVLEKGGDIWIADAGQSDVSAALVRRLKELKPEFSSGDRVHIVQHSDWNESVTTREDLSFVKKETQYHKIPDGNAVGNGSPGFRTEKKIDPASYLSDGEAVAIWKHALELGNKYNGAENRYYNKAIGKGGLDFSDLSEVCYIFNLEDLEDASAFFSYLSQP